MPRTDAKGRIARPRNFKELFLFRLNTLAGVYSRIVKLQNKRRFRLSMLDSRIIGVLGAFSPMSLNRVAWETNLDKGRASRSVATLITSGTITRGIDETDGRAVKLVLTKKGKALYRQLFPIAERRNQDLLQVLTSAERVVIDRAIDKLSTRVLEMLSEERAVTAKTTKKRSPASKPARSGRKR